MKMSKNSGEEETESEETHQDRGALPKSPTLREAEPGKALKDEPVWRGNPVLASFYPFIIVAILVSVFATIWALSFTMPLWVAGILIFFVVMMLGLPLVFQRAWTFEVGAETIHSEFDLGIRRTKSIPLDEVTDAVTFQSLAGRLLGFGTVRVDTAGTPFPGVRFRGVREHLHVCSLIRDCVGESGESAEET